MADIFTGELTMADDWGNVINDQFPEGAQASGKSVQDFIKKNLGQISTKASKFYSIDDTDSNQNVLLYFESESKYKTWQDIVDAAVAEGGSILDYIENDNVLGNIRLNKAQPQAYNSVSLENKMDSNIVISTDNTVVLKFRFISTHYEPSGNNLIPTPTNEEGSLIVQSKSIDSNIWTTKYETTIASSNDSNSYTELDLTEYLTNGRQFVRVQVTGQSTNLTTNILEYDVTKTNLGLSFANSWWEAQENTNDMKLKYYITGAVDKTIHIKVTGPGGTGERIYEEVIGKTIFGENSGTPRTISLTDSISIPYKVLTEGIHQIEAWITVNNTNIRTESVFSNVLMVPDTSLCKTPYIILNNINNELTNWTNQKLFDYSLYYPGQSYAPLSFSLEDYNDNSIYLSYVAESEECEKSNALINMIEVETENSISAKMVITTDSINGPILLDELEFFIINNNKYSPTPDANFIFNPKLRNNNESESERLIIKNSVNNEIVNSEWDGFNFTTDGWVEDDNNNKCLRVLAGQTLKLNYNPYSNWEGNSCTIEMVVASRNISSEDCPILSMSRRASAENYEDYNGFEMWPTEAIFKTPGKKNNKTQDIVFREGVPTHIAINIMHNIYPSNQINLVRIFVNGVINREFAYKDDTLADVGADLSNNPRYILFGNKNAGADLDIYSIRIYKHGLNSTNILQDYIASLPTTVEKDNIILKNNIIGDNGTIDYNLVKNKYNTILWKYSDNEQAAFERGEIDNAPQTRMVGLAEGNHDDTKDTRQYGDLVIRIIKDNGEVDMDRSGKFNDMSAQGQGTSSMGYWKWNQRWVFQKEGEDKDKDGVISKYTTVFTTEDPNSSNNGKKAWQPFEGAPFAKKLDAKLNWASSMQSHKIGSTGMYNDLWKMVIKDNEITKLGTTHDGVKFTGTPDGYASCRVTVGQVPFLLFCQKNKDSQPEFYGLYTMGPSKGDKPTFGYNDDDELFKNFSMIEGCDNGTPLVMGQVPWNDDDITMDSKGEVFEYNGSEQYELSMGETGLSYATNSPTIQNFKEWNRFVYLLNPHLNYYNGTLEELQDGVQKNAPIDKTKFYWLTGNYNVYRFDNVKGYWVNAGINYINDEKTEYEVLNIRTQTGIDNPRKSYAEQNQEFINARVDLFRQRIEEWFDKDDLLFTMSFLKLIAASDNWAKNTYIYNAGFTDSEGKLTSKWRFFQDDLDTIFSIDNSGYKVKPYYVEEHDISPEGKNYFNSDANSLYCLAELAYPSELRSMMNRILTAAAAIGGSVTGCFDKYYTKVLKYFPKVAYNECVRLLYEDGYINQEKKIYNGTTDPLSQALGDQLEGEQEWQKKRAIYMSSFAQFGEFSAADSVTSAGALNFRSAQIIDKNNQPAFASYKFELTPYMYLYPSMAKGGSSLMPIDSSDNTGKTKHTLPPRTKPGETVVFSIPQGDIDGNTQLYIRGINHYQNIGNMGNISVNSNFPFTLGGSRLTTFIATDEQTDLGMAFRPTELSVPNSGMDNIKRFIVRGKVMGNVKIVEGLLDLSGLWRLEEVDVTATSINNISLPINSNITSLSLPSTLTTLNLSYQTKLENFSVSGVRNIENVTFIGSPKLKSLDFIKILMDNNVSLKKCHIDNINWSNVTTDQLKYLINSYDCELGGVINMSTDNDGTIDFDLKTQLINKFGDVDNPSNKLYINYKHTQITDKGKIIGGSYVSEDGTYNYSLSIKGNLFSNWEWSITANDYAIIDSKSGILTYTDNPTGGIRSAKIICKIYVPYENEWMWYQVAEKTIYFEERQPQIGDYVYSDGSVSAKDDLIPNKTPIGVCFYVNGNDRRMIALNNIQSTVNDGKTLKDILVPWGIETISSNNSNISNIPNIKNLNDFTDTGSADRYYVYYKNVYDSDNNTFKSYSNTVALGNIEEVTLTNSLTTEIPEFTNGMVVPIGLKQTLEIIEHRNEKIYKNTDVNKDGEMITGLPGKIYDKYVRDEFDHLTELILASAGTDTNTNNNWATKASYYYPAASYCYAYEPDIEGLNDKFKKHNWYLPTFAELARVWWCQTQGGNSNSLFGDLFKNLKDLTWSSTERNNSTVWAFDLSGTDGNGNYIFTTGNNKTTKMYVRPAARF